jgi:two-component system, OmpR family, alkaline phosphatase synthesis response regulator PhoP
MSHNKKNTVKILLVEDEESLAIGLEYNLTEEGYHVKIARDGRQALLEFKSDNYDLVVLDIMLPYLDGFEVAKEIRNKDPQMPILVLTARTSADDRVRGLELGVDDYLTKPFNLEELLLRIKGMLKRKKWYKSAIIANNTYKIADREINFETLTLTSGSGITPLTVHEGMLLKYLIENKDRIVSRRELLENVWQIHSEIETRTVDTFIARLRKLLEKDPANPDFIKSVRGAGYIYSENNP